MEYNTADLICSVVFGICTGVISVTITSDGNKRRNFFLIFATAVFSLPGALCPPLAYPLAVAAVVVVLTLSKMHIADLSAAAALSAASSFVIMMFVAAVVSPCVEAYSYTLRETFYYYAVHNKALSAASISAALVVIFGIIWLCRLRDSMGGRLAVCGVSVSLAAATIMLLHMCAGWLIDYNAKYFKFPIYFSVLNGAIALLCVFIACIFTSRLRKSAYIPERLGALKEFYLILSAIICTVLFYCYENTILNNYTTFDNPRYKYTVSILIVLMIVTILTALIAVSAYTLRARAEKAHIEKQIELTAMYRDEIRDIRREIFDFKHDYVKIYSSMSAFLINKEYDKLRDFFDRNIVPLQKELINSGTGSKELAMLEDEAVQGLLYSYIMKAKKASVNLLTDIRDHIPISSVPVIDLNRLLGIFLDNAIEHAIKSDKTVCFAAIRHEDCIMFVITNSSEGVDMERMFRYGESTKGSGRGRGLAIARKICAAHDELSMHTYSRNGKFISEIYIDL